MTQIPTPPPAPQPITDEMRLNAYLQCELAILTGHQSYTIEGTGTFTRADLGRVQSLIMELRGRVMSAAARPSVGGIRTTQVVF